jgi:3-phosphoshikimate 1-carboxyvinyltransferase
VKSFEITKKRFLKGEICAPGDKSISHRAVILGSLAEGKSRVTNFCPGEDTQRTISAFRALGIEIEGTETSFTVCGKGLDGLSESLNVVDAGNSGTTMRLLAGLLSGQGFFSVLTGDDSLRTRPMKRVTEPLRAMGAVIDGRNHGDYAPLAIRGGELTPLTYQSPVASAQIKSALLLAGLYVDGETQVTEPSSSRDHTERMLRAMGAKIETTGTTVRLKGRPELTPFSLFVPGDISSAAFFVVAAALLPGSEIVIRKVGVNPLRTGILDVLQQMGADISLANVQDSGGEPIADIVVKASPLRATEISGDVVPRTIDEIPILAVAAACAEGTTLIREARELRVKETDRITAMANGLRQFGVPVEEFPDGMAITGQIQLKGAKVTSYGDHRVAMAFTVAGLTASGKTVVEDTESIATSFPGFMESLELLAH